MLGRAVLRGRNHPHAYLVLLRIEVAAFHPALSGSRTNLTPGRPPGGAGLHLPPTQTRLCGPVPERQARCHAQRPTAVSRYPALWSPDLPRCEDTPRLPSLPCVDIVCQRPSWAGRWLKQDLYRLHRMHQNRQAWASNHLNCDNNGFAV